MIQSFHFQSLNISTSPSPPLQNPGFRFLSKSPCPLSKLNPRLLRFRSIPIFKVARADGSGGERLGSAPGGFLGRSGSGLPVEMCRTCELEPALTLRDGAKRIREAVEKLRSDPPCTRSGVLRFQVSVPTSSKALKWLCSQPDSMAALPQFYLCAKQCKNLSYEVDSSHQLVGISGIGLAVYFTDSTMEDQNSLKRYLSLDAPLVKAYGFIGFNYNIISISMKDEVESSFFFIPQIELDEYETGSLLVATLVWDDFSSHTFENALSSFDLSFSQASFTDCSICEHVQNKFARSIQGKRGFKEDQNIQMVYLDANSLVGKDTKTNNSQLVDDCHHSCSFLQERANINMAWASLIIEECTRLGLIYFCVAPGSRSSPLAIAASSHPHITCISCIDERSLAFHAVGYGRGSHCPAVIITSSGTAVSNLLPAVVEASHAFIPLVLLTADRPPELQNTGANQSINQVNHFGSFVRFFFNLPPPTDDIPARMVLTTVDSAVYNATQPPYGPVHLNCSFREPLENSPKKWDFSCLKGLNHWMSTVEPFTKYIRLQPVDVCGGIISPVSEVLEIIRCANQGLLLIGGLQTEDEIRAVILLAKHLFWPIVADILSGLRLRRCLASPTEFGDNFLFLDHIDHALFSDSVKALMKPDVVMQIGSRITSKRVSQMLEACSPISYILVDKHPYRHDPSHIVTHRVQSAITEFADCLLKVSFPRKNTSWRSILEVLNKMVSWEIAFQVHSENSLTEPYVAQAVSEVLECESTLFLGNSMAIRDADMYGQGWVKSATYTTPVISTGEISFPGIRATGNRGASGIDGLLSTAIGYAVGCEKRVVCVIGDISFLHDTNGLAILKQRTRRKPMTIVILNNHGGAIFSLLPVADKTQTNILNQFFYTCHDVSIRKLADVYGIKHLGAHSKSELLHALSISKQLHTDCIIEVESSIEKNAAFHRFLSKCACQAANHVVSVLSRLSVSNNLTNASFNCKVNRMEYCLYRIELSAPLTSTPIDSTSNRFYKEGFLVTIYLEDGSVGVGEVSPIEIHKENLVDVEEQLRCLLHVTEGCSISFFLPLLKSSFSSWIWRCLGLPPSSIFPSVRCGLEMAILNALAASQGSSLLDLILGNNSAANESQPNKAGKRQRPARVQICALLDSNGTPKEMAHAVSQLIDEGFTTIKLKVGRRVNPVEDAAVVQEIRKKVGFQIKLRVDANRRWTYEAATKFGFHVKHCDLQYIEEPVRSEDDIIKFCEETGLPVALDETIDYIEGDPLIKLMEFIHPGIVALVIKPGVVGGFEKAAQIAKWAQRHNKIAVISSAFESGVSLASYIQFAYYIDLQKDVFGLKDLESFPRTAHGLGTYQWLKEDVAIEPLKISLNPEGSTPEVPVKDASLFFKKFKINDEVVYRKYYNEQVRTYSLTVDCGDLLYSFKVRDAGSKTNKKVIIFLHGFLGSGEDWVPMMKALSATTRCISVDLPGHGKSHLQKQTHYKKQEFSMSFEVVADLLQKLISAIVPGRVVIAGYSMGARLALYMALRCDKIAGAVVISGSPGLRDENAQKIRAAQDIAKAQYLVRHGLQCFLETWYAGQLWNSLRRHPCFEQIVDRHSKHDDLHALSKSLSELSVGRQRSLWEHLSECNNSLLIIAGEHDRKFKEIAQSMYSEINVGLEAKENSGSKILEMCEIPECGHAVHLENPLPLINAMSEFINKLYGR